MSALIEALADVRKIIKPPGAEARGGVELNLDEKMATTGMDIDLTGKEEGPLP